jgi:hypothetical protein
MRLVFSFSLGRFERRADDRFVVKDRASSVQDEDEGMEREGVASVRCHRCRLNTTSHRVAST